MDIKKQQLDQQIAETITLTSEEWYAKYPTGDFFQYQEEAIKRRLHIGSKANISKELDDKMIDDMQIFSEEEFIAKYCFPHQAEESQVLDWFKNNPAKEVISINTLERLAGVSRSTFQNFFLYERGISSESFQKLLPLVKALGFSLVTAEGTHHE